MSARLALALALTLAPGAATAAGVALPVRGVRPLGVGGAFVAGAEEVNALWSNPARLDASALVLEVGLTDLVATYTDPSGASASNLATPLPNPTLGLVWRIDERLSVAVGAFAPWAPQHAFPEDGPQRYALVESRRTSQLFLTAALALRLGPVRLGAGVANVVSRVHQRVVLSGYTGLFGAPDDPELDLLGELDLRDGVTLTGNAGASVDLGPVTLAGAVQLPYTVAGEASFRVRLASSAFFDPVRVEGDRVAFSVPLPLMLRGGLLWRATPGLSVELAAGWEGWSVQDRLVLDPGGRIVLRGVPGVGDYRLGPIGVERRMRDTLSLHLGARWQALEALELSAGAFREASAFPDETFSVAQVDGDKLGLTAGARWALGPLRLDLAVGRVFQATREVTEGALRQINPTNPGQALPVGLGRTTSGLWIGGLGVAWRFGDG